MNLTAHFFKRLLRRKIATVALITASVGAFATLGDGGKKGERTFSAPAERLTAKNFSLKTNPNFRSSSLYSPAKQGKYIMLNTTVTYQKGNATYIVPLKKKVFLADKVKFNPAPVKF